MVASTLNPYTGDTDAVTEPDAILYASPVNADNGILNNPSPLPLKYPDPDGIVKLPVTNNPPVNWFLPPLNVIVSAVALN